MTGYGGQADFLLPGAAWLVDYKLVPVEDREGRLSYSNEQQWAEPDLNQAARFMREAASDRGAAQERGRRLRGFIQERFNPHHVTRCFLEALAKESRPE